MLSKSCVILTAKRSKACVILTAKRSNACVILTAKRSKERLRVIFSSSLGERKPETYSFSASSSLERRNSLSRRRRVDVL